MNKRAFIRRSGGSKTYASDNERLIAEIQEVLPSVQNDEFTTSGKPLVEVIEAMLGEQITEAQRDEAWKQYNAQPAIEDQEPEAEEDEVS